MSQKALSTVEIISYFPSIYTLERSNNIDCLNISKVSEICKEMQSVKKIVNDALEKCENVQKAKD